MPTNLPPIANFTGSSVTEAGYKTEMTNLLAALRDGGDPMGSAGLIQNLGLSFAVGSSALTITMRQRDGSTAPDSTNVVTIPFRSATASSGGFNMRNVTSAITLTVSSGATLGHTNGVAAPIYWYAIDNSGTVELAASTRFFGLTGIVTTTAMSGSATSATVMYSTSARTNVPFTCIARTVDTQTTAGTWAATPSETFLFPATALVFIGDGSLTNPASNLAFTFDNDTDTGIYRAAANTIGFAANGAAAVRVTNPSSAVNYIALQGSGAGGFPRIGVEGTDSTIPIQVCSKGANSIFFRTGGPSDTTQFAVGHLASAVNYMLVSGSATGFSPTLQSVGSDTNVGMNITTQGTGALVFNVNGAERFRVASAGQLGIAGANYGTTGQVFTSNGSGAAPSWNTLVGARCFVNFDGTPGSPTIRSSSNVTSITKHATGQYTVNATSTLGGTDYAVVVTCSTSAATNAANPGNYGFDVINSSSTAFRIHTASGGAGCNDMAIVNAAVF